MIEKLEVLKDEADFISKVVIANMVIDIKVGLPPVAVLRFYRLDLNEVMLDKCSNIINN